MLSTKTPSIRSHKDIVVSGMDQLIVKLSSECKSCTSSSEISHIYFNVAETIILFGYVYALKVHRMFLFLPQFKI